MTSHTTRIDGPAKVTGAVRYSSDVFLPGMAHAAIVTSHIGRGRVLRIDSQAARALAGMLGVFTHTDLADAVTHVPHLMAGGYVNSSALPLGSDEVRHAGQIVALVVAETSDMANEAASLIIVEYEVHDNAMDLDDPRSTHIRLSDVRDGYEDVCHGDAEEHYANASVQIDAVYRTPMQHHNPIEPFTTLCSWDGAQLTVREPTRYVGAVQHGLAQQLHMDPADIHVICPLIGGHFGSKLALGQYTALIAVVARRIGRPVSFVPTRDQCFTIANHRPGTRHRIRLGASADGKITALLHDAQVSTSRFDDFAMEGTDVTASLYGIPNVLSSETIVRIDSNTPGPMRAPPEVPYLFALESAVDELAARLCIDPVELRRLNDTSVDLISGKPFRPRMLMQCFDAGAAAFGWHRRSSVPARVRDGDWLIGMGCASAVRPAKIGAVIVRVLLTEDGRIEVHTAHHEIGNGLYTILANEASGRLGVPMERIDVYLGDTRLPPASLSGGSSTTGSLIPALQTACERLLQHFLALSGGVSRLNDCMAIKRMFAETGIRNMDAWGETGTESALGKLREGKIALSSIDDYPRWVYGAQFAEVRVHALTREIRVTRLLGAFAPGRVVNVLTTMSQLKGAMVWGLGSALLEETLADTQCGRFLNANLADYLVPVSADATHLEAILVPGPDDTAGPVKGVGEIGIIGVNAAIANAVFNATGTRSRQLPIRTDTLLADTTDPVQ